MIDHLGPFFNHYFIIIKPFEDYYIFRVTWQLDFFVCWLIGAKLNFHFVIAFATLFYFESVWDQIRILQDLILLELAVWCWKISILPVSSAIRPKSRLLRKLSSCQSILRCPWVCRLSCIVSRNFPIEFAIFWSICWYLPIQTLSGVLGSFFANRQYAKLQMILLW